MHDMKVYHGTSADNLPSILEHGFDGMYHGEQVWTCSAGLNYFWNPAHLKKSCGLDTMADAINEAKRMAKDSAEAALGYATKDCRRVVFEVELKGIEWSKDTSCQNMDGAIMVSGTVPASAITAIWIDAEPLTALKGYFIACGMDRDLRCEMELSKVDRVIGEAFKASSDAMCKIFELLSDMELIPFDKPQ